MMIFHYTEQELEKVIESYFTSLNPLVLKQFPGKEKKRYMVLTLIEKHFETNRIYTEKEVNSILKSIYDDFATIRRYLVDYGFLKREIDGSKYYKINQDSSNL